MHVFFGDYFCPLCLGFALYMDLFSSLNRGTKWIWHLCPSETNATFQRSNLRWVGPRSLYRGVSRVSGPTKDGTAASTLGRGQQTSLPLLGPKSQSGDRLQTVRRRRLNGEGPLPGARVWLVPSAPSSTLKEAPESHTPWRRRIPLRWPPSSVAKPSQKPKSPWLLMDVIQGRLESGLILDIQMEVVSKMSYYVYKQV